jgi:hypothetical protein
MYKPIIALEEQTMIKFLIGKTKGIGLFAAAAVLVAAFWGCAAMRGKSAEGGAASGENPADIGPMPYYHDFIDVLIPAELKPIQKESFTFRSPGFSTGLLVLEGKVDAASLANFFENNMAKDNWQIVNAFKYRPVMLLFEKVNRNCVIRIDEASFKTRVEIWIASATVE